MSNKLLIISILYFGSIVCCSEINGQTEDLDITILKDRINNNLNDSNKISQVNKSKSVITRPFYGALKFYKKNISQQISAECLYEISCSTFSQMAIKEFGILKGVALTADRLARCNRISGTTINEFRVNENGKVIDTPHMYKIDND